MVFNQFGVTIRVDSADDGNLPESEEMQRTYSY